MKAAVLFSVFLIWAQMPKNDPNGVWEAQTGSRFTLRLTGSNLNVRIVEGSNPRYLQYELDLKNTEEVNTYKGSGRFTAKLQNGKECQFDTDWQIVVVSPERILGVASSIVPDPETCAAKEKGQIQLDMKKK
jgi:hypothetical protein